MISVIIPNYNHGKYLVQRIESVLNQTYRNFEVIILDDCSTDNSRDVIESYRGHEKITKIVYNNENSGSTFRQWNKGLELASGEWIWYAESDDWCELNFLESLMDGLKRSQQSLSMIFCNTFQIQEEEIVYRTDFNKLHHEHDGNAFISKYMLRDNKIMNASMALFNKEVAKNISKEWIEFRLCGDWLFWIFLMKDNQILEVGKVLNYFRKHNESVSSSNNPEKIILPYKEKPRFWEILKDKNIISEYSYIRLVVKYWESVIFSDAHSTKEKKHFLSLIKGKISTIDFYKNVITNKCYDFKNYFSR
jgi:glycosyltransferase involved in cell wall biosynthesis